MNEVSACSILRTDFYFRFVFCIHNVKWWTKGHTGSQRQGQRQNIYSSILQLVIRVELMEKEITTNSSYVHNEELSYLQDWLFPIIFAHPTRSNWWAHFVSPPWINAIWWDPGSMAFPLWQLHFGVIPPTYLWTLFCCL